VTRSPHRHSSGFGVPGLPQVERIATAPTPTERTPTIRTVPMPAPAPLLWDVTEVATVLGVSRSFVYELLNAGELDFCKLGARTKVPVATVQQYVDRRLAERHAEAEAVERAITARRF
jgi:excisionase family DNA binding protein